MSLSLLKKKSSTKPDTILNSSKKRKSNQPLFDLQKTIGNKGMQRLSKSGILQAKFKISQPSDPYEIEADRVSEQIMRTLKPNISRKPSNTTSNLEASNETSNEINRVKGSGKPLDSSTKEFMESRFNHDFSDVKVHNDSESNALANSIDARAFTVGKNVFLGKNELKTDKKLMAHELTHVIQQNGGSTADGKKITALPNTNLQRWYKKTSIGGLTVDNQQGKLIEEPEEDINSVKMTTRAELNHQDQGTRMQITYSREFLDEFEPDHDEQEELNLGITPSVLGFSIASGDEYTGMKSEASYAIYDDRDNEIKKETYTAETLAFKGTPDRDGPYGEPYTHPFRGSKIKLVRRLLNHIDVNKYTTNGRFKAEATASLQVVDNTTREDRVLLDQRDIQKEAAEKERQRREENRKVILENIQSNIGRTTIKTEPDGFDVAVITDGLKVNRIYHNKGTRQMRVYISVEKDEGGLRIIFPKPTSINEHVDEDDGYQLWGYRPSRNMIMNDRDSISRRSFTFIFTQGDDDFVVSYVGY